MKKNQRPSAVRYGFISGAWFRCAGFGRGDLAEGHLDAEVPPEDVGAGPQQRDLDDLAPAGEALLEHRGEDAGQARRGR